PASTLDEGQLAVGVMFEYVNLRTLSDGTLIKAAVTGNEGVHDLKTIESVSAIVAYGLTHDFTVGMRVPWVGRTAIREGDASVPLNPVVLDRGGPFGFSDVTFLGQYRFFNDKKTQTEAAVLLGVKAPTGATNRYDNQGELFDAEFQPGTAPGTACSASPSRSASARGHSTATCSTSSAAREPRIRTSATGSSTTQRSPIA